MKPALWPESATADDHGTASDPAAPMVPDPDDLRIANVMIVEDNPGDVELAMLGFQSRGIITDVHIAQDAERAIAFFRHILAGDESWRPDLVLVDLNLPGIGGHEVVRFIKEHETLCGIPTAVLTSSSALPDYVRCSSYGADTYLTKPMTLSELMEVMDHLERLLDGRT